MNTPPLVTSGPSPQQPGYYGAPGTQPLVTDLKARLTRLQQELGDTGQFTGDLPKDDVDDRPKQLDRKHPDSQL